MRKVKSGKLLTFLAPQVHWVYPYAKLRAANVLSTVAAIMLCATGKPKTFTFVSSTSALDTDHYVRLSDSIAVSNVTSGSSSMPRALAGVPETDDLGGSARGLGTGYGQSKWVSERLVMACAARGLRACIVRPGYVVGDSVSAVTNTDDFLWRLVKGSTQLGLVPDMHNAINMVPVDHVARVTALAALATHREAGDVPGTAARVYHVTAHPLIRFNDLLSALARHGWTTKKADYVQWRSQLEEHVLKSAPKEGDKDAQESNALFPLVSRLALVALYALIDALLARSSTSYSTTCPPRPSRPSWTTRTPRSCSTQRKRAA